MNSNSILCVLFLIIGICLTNAYHSYAAKTNDNLNVENKVDISKFHMYGNQIVIDGSYNWGTVNDTGSMRPSISDDSIVIYLTPISERDVSVGDIVVRQAKSPSQIIHRIVEIGTDSEGTYYITKGDNNVFRDPKIRFENITFVVAGVIY